MNYVENISIDITEHLDFNKNQAIKKVLTVLDMSDVGKEHRLIIRKVVLDAFGDVYLSTCRVLTAIQEKQNETIKSNNRI